MTEPFQPQETESLEVYIHYARKYPAAHSYLLLSGTESTIFDVIFMTKRSSRIKKEYYAFLFEKILLFFKQIPVERNSTGALPASPTSQKSWRQSNMKLLLKGKIHVNNTVSVETVKSSSLSPSYHLLAVWWEASKDDDLNYFVIQAQHELQMQKWSGTINNVVYVTYHYTPLSPYNKIWLHDPLGSSHLVICWEEDILSPSPGHEALLYENYYSSGHWFEVLDCSVYIQYT
ncbi:hypothetical protein L218DRAFT_950145 [Marasmius fiardii PR-910]|nr:hypothetical protein L218DRAFT_950145 [Marasmius fiardii PR-910]